MVTQQSCMSDHKALIGVTEMQIYCYTSARKQKFHEFNSHGRKKTSLACLVHRNIISIWKDGGKRKKILFPFFKKKKKNVLLYFGGKRGVGWVGLLGCGGYKSAGYFCLLPSSLRQPQYQQPGVWEQNYQHQNPSSAAAAVGRHNKATSRLNTYAEKRDGRSSLPILCCLCHIFVALKSL